ERPRLVFQGLPDGARNVVGDVDDRGAGGRGVYLGGEPTGLRVPFGVGCYGVGGQHDSLLTAVRGRLVLVVGGVTHDSAPCGFWATPGAGFCAVKSESGAD